MSSGRSPSSQPVADGFKPMRVLLRLAVIAFLLGELHLALTLPGYDVRTRGLFNLVLLFSALGMVARGLPEGRPQGLLNWIRATCVVLLVIEAELELFLVCKPLTWPPFARGVGCLVAAILIARLRFSPDRATRPRTRSA